MSSESSVYECKIVIVTVKQFHGHFGCRWCRWVSHCLYFATIRDPPFNGTFTSVRGTDRSTEASWLNSHKNQKTFSEASGLARGSTKPPVKWVMESLPPRLKWPQCEADYLSSSNAECYNRVCCCAQERFFFCFRHKNLTRQ
jgi:hypothetical protein